MTLPYFDKNTLYEEIVRDKKRNREPQRLALPCNWKPFTTALILSSVSEQRRETICILSLRRNNVKLDKFMIVGDSVDHSEIVNEKMINRTDPVI